MTTAAVTIIVLAVFTLVVMTGIGGYTIGRAHAGAAKVKSDENLHEVLVDCKDKILTVSDLLKFQLDQVERYSEIARQAVKSLPSKDIQRLLLERKLQEADGLLQAKIAEVEEVTKKG